MKKEPEINFIVLKRQIREDKSNIIDDYLEILKTCLHDEDRRCLLEQLYDEVAYTIGETFVEKQISKNAEILEEMKKEFSR